MYPICTIYAGYSCHIDTASQTSARTALYNTQVAIPARESEFRARFLAPFNGARDPQFESEHTDTRETVEPSTATPPTRLAMRRDKLRAHVALCARALDRAILVRSINRRSVKMPSAHRRRHHRAIAVVQARSIARAICHLDGSQTADASSSSRCHHRRSPASSSSCSLARSPSAASSSSSRCDCDGCSVRRLHPSIPTILHTHTH